jgi:hypothetical protein
MQYRQKASAVPMKRCTQTIIILVRSCKGRLTRLLKVKKGHHNFSEFGKPYKSGTGFDDQRLEVSNIRKHDVTAKNGPAGNSR